MHSSRKTWCFLCLGIALVNQLPAITPDATNTKEPSPAKAEAAPKKYKYHAKSKKQQAATANKMLSQMNYTELKAEKARLAKRSDEQGVLHCLEKMIPLATDPKDLQDATFELASILFKQEKYAEAQTMFTDFVKFYPGEQRVEEASYKAIECCYKQILEADRDQTKTKETLELTKPFLARPIFTTFRTKVNEIVHACNQRLWDNEEYIITLYIQRGKFIGAKKHIEALQKNFLPLLPECSVRALALESSLADAMNVPAKAQELRTLIQAKLKEDPTLQQTPLVVAEANSGKQGKSFFSRF